MEIIKVVVDGHYFIFDKDRLIDLGYKQSIEDGYSQLPNGIYSTIEHETIEM